MFLLTLFEIVLNPNGVIHADENVFKFVDWNTMHTACNQIYNIMPWFFYDLTGTMGHFQNKQWEPFRQFIQLSLLGSSNRVANILLFHINFFV